MEKDCQDSPCSLPEESCPELCECPNFYKQWKLIGDPSDYIDSLIQNFGDFIHCRGVIDFYLINSPDLVAQVCKQTHKFFNKQTSIYKRFRHALGDSLVNSEGEHWKRQRRLMTPTFTKSAIESYFQLMQTQVTTYLKTWDESEGQEIQFEEAMNHLTLQVAGSVLFSSSFEEKAEDVYRWVKVISKFSARPPLPIIGDPNFPRPLTYKTNKVLKEFKDYIDELIADREGEEHDDLFSVFLNMVDEETGEPMSHDEVAEEVLGMIFGSHESSATALTWLFYELTENPECLEKVREEVKAVVGDRSIALEDLEELKYTEQVIYETLRLHPSFWFENRKAITEVELCGHTLKEGDLVAFSRYSLHRNPKAWPNPNRFDPERFDTEKVDLKALFRSGSYMPFGMGPRHCIGKNFAMMEMVLITAHIIQNYEVQRSGKCSGEKVTNLTMELKSGLAIKVTKTL